MRIQETGETAPDALLPGAEGEGACDAWTLEELGDDLGVLHAVVSGNDDPG